MQNFSATMQGEGAAGRVGYFVKALIGIFNYIYISAVNSLETVYFIDHLPGSRMNGHL